MSTKHVSLKGQLLLDGGNLRGSFFHRSVVLICQHDESGAFGLIINRSAGNKVGEAVVANLPDLIKDQSLYIGGPVQPNALSFLHTDTFLTEANVMPNLHLDHSIDALAEIGESFSAAKQIRVYAGYAGWSPGQLDDEMRRQAWLTHPASLELVFHQKPEILWRSILRGKGFRYRLLADSPDDLAWN